MNTEVTIYEKNDKMYCEGCKPKSGKRGTFGTSEYDHFCAGCGEDLKEIGEEKKQAAYEQFHIGQQVEVIAGYYTGNKGTVINLQPQPDGTAIVQVQWRNNQTKYIPSIALTDNTILQQAWNALQSVPAYVERKQ